MTDRSVVAACPLGFRCVVPVVRRLLLLPVRRCGSAVSDPDPGVRGSAAAAQVRPMPLRRRPRRRRWYRQGGKPPVVSRMDSRRRSTAPSGPSAGSNPGVIPADNASGRHLRAAESQPGSAPFFFLQTETTETGQQAGPTDENELTVHTAQHATSGPTTDPSHPPQGFAPADPAADPPSETPLLPLTELDDEIERLGVPVPCRPTTPRSSSRVPADVEYAKSSARPVRSARLPRGAKDRRARVSGAASCSFQGVVVPASGAWPPPRKERRRGMNTRKTRASAHRPPLTHDPKNQNPQTPRIRPSLTPMTRRSVSSPHVPPTPSWRHQTGTSNATHARSLLVPKCTATARGRTRTKVHAPARRPAAAAQGERASLRAGAHWPWP